MRQKLLLGLAGTLLGAPLPLVSADAEAQATQNAPQDEVIVTARKREEALTEVPLAISAYSEEDFEKRNINDLADVATFTPGFAFESYSGGITPAPVIRGLSQTALQNRIQNVGVFLDGVYIQQQGNVDFGLLGIERIEVVKGPQSALYGRNSFAGAINYVTKGPSEELEADVTYTLGSDEREDVKASISGAIVPGILTARLNVGTTEFDGTHENYFFVRNATTGNPIENNAISFLQGKGTDGNLQGYDNEAQSASVRFTPTDDWQFDLGIYKVEIRREDGATVSYEPSTNAAALNQLNCNPRPVPPSNTNPNTNTLWCGQLEGDADELIRDPRSIGNYADTRIWTFGASYDINDSLTAKYLFGRTNLDAYSMGIGSGVTVITGAGTMSLREQPVTQLEADSHELRLEWESERFTVLGGVYTTDVEDINVFNSYNVQTLVSGGNIVPGPGPFAGDGIFQIANEAYEDKIYSVFGSVDYRIRDDLTLGFEGRFTREEKDYVDLRPNGISADDTFNYFSPRVSLDWLRDSDTLYYASIAQGEKAGGFNGATADPGYDTYDPETNITYEIGGKFTLVDGTVQFNTAVYYIDWDDLQISFVDVVPVDPEATVLEPSYIGNGKGAESYGVEFDVTWAITDTVTANAMYSFTHSEYASGTYDASLGSTCNPDLCNIFEIPVEGTDLVQLAADIGGNDLSRSPESQAALGIEYDREIQLVGNPLQFTARGDVVYQDEMFGDVLNLSVVEDRTLVNGSLIFAGQERNWYVSLWAKNLFDEEYISNTIVTGSPRRYINNFGEGRTMGVTVNVSLQ